MLIDIHTHLDHAYFDKDRNKVVENAEKENVKVILTAGINPETNRKTLELAKKYEIVKASLGIYPVQTLKKEIEEAGEPLKFYDFDIDEEIRFIEENKDTIVGVGEVGLDYKWTRDHDAEQKELFQKMISLAERINKPIIVHSRKAESDCIDMLSSSKIKGVLMHCFSGKKKLVKKIVDKGWYLTAPTCIVRSPQFQSNVRMTPITQLFCETDAPYLSPFKDKRNEPAFVAEAYKQVAELKGMEVEEVVNSMWMNWQKVF